MSNYKEDTKMTTEATEAQHKTIVGLTQASTRARDASRLLRLCQDSVEIAANASGDTELWDLVREMHDLIHQVNQISVKTYEKLYDTCGGDLE